MTTVGDTVASKYETRQQKLTIDNELKAETARQRNRRVELFVVPNEPGLAKWDPLKATR